jgi:hypothetical protein
MPFLLTGNTPSFVKNSKHFIRKKKDMKFMKMIVFWDVAPYSLVEVYRRFGGAYCFHHQGDEVSQEERRLAEPRHCKSVTSTAVDEALFVVRKIQETDENLVGHPSVWTQ